MSAADTLRSIICTALCGLASAAFAVLALGLPPVWTLPVAAFVIVVAFPRGGTNEH